MPYTYTRWERGRSVVGFFVVLFPGLPLTGHSSKDAELLLIGNNWRVTVGNLLLFGNNWRVAKDSLSLVRSNWRVTIGGLLLHAVLDECCAVHCPLIMSCVFFCVVCRERKRRH